jgi:hypothetical protein
VPSDTPASDQAFETQVVPLEGADPAHEDCFPPFRLQTIAVVPEGAVTWNCSEVMPVEVITGAVVLPEMPAVGHVTSSARLLALRPESWPALLMVVVSVTEGVLPENVLQLTVAETCLKSVAPLESLLSDTEVTLAVTV